MPDGIERALGPGRAAGLLPTFPFGCEFTEVEQRLLPTMRAVKAASGSPPRLARLAASGLSGALSTEAHEALRRLGLDRPRTLKEHLFRALVRGALKER